ncbi:MAG: hypothetical protein GF344_02630 [Chitinivibrionales bacterium]|nr:hypothetical protein [Chitinivibrionales bacterium]MBD3355979.1 hypothetical protein [Chitinivibrionales bacterium]
MNELENMHESRVGGIVEWLLEYGPVPVREALKECIRRREELCRRWSCYIAEPWRSHPLAASVALCIGRSKNEIPLTAEELSLENRIHPAINFFPLMRTPRPTAIVAPNDLSAICELIPSLQEYGFRIPEDLSLISFDNHFSYSFQTLTSVDFGFDYLGAQAFRFITGMLQANRTRKGDIPARPIVVNNGSMAAVDRLDKD